LTKVSEQTITDLRDIVEEADTTDISMPEDSNAKTVYEDALVIQNHLQSGGKLGWGPFRPEVVKPLRYIIKTIRVNGRKCNCLDNVALLVDVLHRGAGIVFVQCAEAF